MICQSIKITSVELSQKRKTCEKKKKDMESKMCIEFLRDNAVWTLNTRRAGQLRNCGSIPGRGKKVFSSPKRPDRFWSLPSLIFNEDLGLVNTVRGVLLSIQLHVVPTLTMGGAIPCAPPIYLHGVYRDNFSFFSTATLPNTLRFCNYLASCDRVGSRNACRSSCKVVVIFSRFQQNFEYVTNSSTKTPQYQT
jgi:hypothetical protein